MGINGSKDNSKVNSQNKYFCEFKGDNRKTISLPVDKIQNMYNSSFIYYDIPTDELTTTTFNLNLKFFDYSNSTKNDECTLNLKKMVSTKNIIDNVEYQDIRKNTEKGCFIYRSCCKNDNAQIIYTSSI